MEMERKLKRDFFASVKKKVWIHVKILLDQNIAKVWQSAEQAVNNSTLKIKDCEKINKLFITNITQHSKSCYFFFLITAHDLNFLKARL